MVIKIQYKISLIVLSIISITAYSQVERELTLKQVIEMAQLQSLDAFIAKNMYLSSYWEFRSYQAQMRPGLYFNAIPANFTNKIEKINTGSGVLLQPTKYTESGMQLYLTQNIAPTGGRISIGPEAQRVKDRIKYDKGDSTAISYGAAPFNISFYQPIFQYNSYKWKTKIEPIKFEKAKREYIKSRENVAMQAIRNYFNLLDAMLARDIALANKTTADTFYVKSLGLYERGSISLNHLQRLELNQLNTALALVRAELALKRSEFNLKSFLRIPEEVEIKLMLPEEIPDIKINPGDALDKAIENNPEILDYQQRLLEADRVVAQAKGETGIDVELNLGLGFEHGGYNVEEALTGFDRNKNLGLSFSIPIVDWGLSKGRRQMAISNKEVVTTTVEKERIEFEQDVMMSAIEFNIMESQVESSEKAKSIADQTYKTISERFLLGKETLETLYASRNEQNSAVRNYYSKVREFWAYYYYMRSLTLYDFENDQSISQNFDDFFNF